MTKSYSNSGSSSIDNSSGSDNGCGSSGFISDSCGSSEK